MGTPREIELLRYSQTRWDRVSYERVCAGQSMPHLYDFLRDVARFPESPAVRAQLADAIDRTPIIMATSAPVELARHALRLLHHHTRPPGPPRQPSETRPTARLVVGGKAGADRST